MNTPAPEFADRAGELPNLPDLPPATWAQIGVGATLVLVGSGLVSPRGLLRLALVAGGGALAYTAWQRAHAHAATSGDDAGPDVRSSDAADVSRTMAEGAGGVAADVTGQNPNTAEIHPFPRDVVASDVADDAADPPTALIDAEGVPPVDVRGG